MGTNSFAQVSHPVNSGIERDGKTHQTDGGALLNGGIDGVFQRGGERRIADVEQDFAEDILQQRRVRSENKTRGGKRHHQDRDHRQKREVGNGGAKLISHTIVKSLRGANQMGNHGLALNFIGEGQGGFQRLVGLTVGFCIFTLQGLNFWDWCVLKFLNGAFNLFFLRHQGSNPCSVHSQDSIACQST